jgi:5-formyltetrahydrofolate cyclo-ligase
MKYTKSFLRKRAIFLRKKNYLKVKKINFKLIFNLVEKFFRGKKIVIAGYSPSNYELDVNGFLQESFKRKFKIVLPVVKSSRNMCFKSWRYKEPLQINKYGILEPNIKNKEIIPDLILVPLVAFDKKLNRIGYGKGYYDRILKKIRKIKKNAIYLGVAYSFQECRSIPVNKHDFKLDYIFTERGIIK